MTRWFTLIRAHATFEVSSSTHYGHIVVDSDLSPAASSATKPLCLRIDTLGM